MYLLSVLEAVSRLEKKQRGRGLARRERLPDALEVFKTNKRCRLKAPSSGRVRAPPAARGCAPPDLPRSWRLGDKESSRGGTSGRRAQAPVLSLGRRRGAVGIAAAKAATSAPPCTAIEARVKQRREGRRSCDAVHGGARQLSPDAPLSTVVDADAILNAVKKQFANTCPGERGTRSPARARSSGWSRRRLFPAPPSSRKQKGKKESGAVGVERRRRKKSKGEKRKGPTAPRTRARR